MTAVKPTAEDLICMRIEAAGMVQDDWVTIVMDDVRDIVREVLASHRQTESEMEAQRVLDLAEDVERNDDWTAGNVVRTLRAYAKLLRGEK